MCLFQIPNFLHLTPPAIKKHCAALKGEGEFEGFFVYLVGCFFLFKPSLEAFRQSKM